MTCTTSKRRYGLTLHAFDEQPATCHELRCMHPAEQSSGDLPTLHTAFQVVLVILCLLCQPLSMVVEMARASEK